MLACHGQTSAKLMLDVSPSIWTMPCLQGHHYQWPTFLWRRIRLQYGQHRYTTLTVLATNNNYLGFKTKTHWNCLWSVSSSAAAVVIKINVHVSSKPSTGVFQKHLSRVKLLWPVWKKNTKMVVFLTLLALHLCHSQQVKSSRKEVRDQQKHDGCVPIVCMHAYYACLGKFPGSWSILILLT